MGKRSPRLSLWATMRRKTFGGTATRTFDRVSTSSLLRRPKDDAGRVVVGAYLGGMGGEVVDVFA